MTTTRKIHIPLAPYHEQKTVGATLEMNDIRECLKKQGECLDTDIAAATGLPLIKVHQSLRELMAIGEALFCNATRFEDGQKIEVMICRLVGRGPVIKQGKKAKSQFGARYLDNARVVGHV
jgi:hypothetical protein